MIEKNQLILFFLLIFISLFFIYFLFLPKYREYLLSKEEFFQSQKILKASQSYFEEMKSFFEKMKAKEEFSKIEDALPEGPKIPETLEFLKNVAFETGLFIKEIAFSIEEPKAEVFEEGSLLSEAQKEKELSQLKINLKMFGSYPSFKNFLAKVENSARLFEIEKISLSFKEKEFFNFEVLLKTFFISKISSEFLKLEKVDFGVLENPVLKSLEAFLKFEPPKPEEIGKENPFLP